MAEAPIIPMHGLPDSGKDLRWPPDDDANSYGKYMEHAAWYGGDVQKLAEVYVGMGAPGSKPQGMVNVVRSWFWGKQAIAPAPRIRIHVPMAADIASTSADLLFSEAPEFAVADEDKNEKIQARLDEIVEQESFTRLLLESAEVASALGGVYLRVTWDQEIAPDRPLLTVIHPDAAVPSFRWGRMVGVTFWHIVKEGDGFTYRHLERHEPGVIYHGLYKGSANNSGGYYRTGGFLGDRVPLTEVPETAALVDGLTDGDIIETGIKRMTAVYVPNMLPNRIDRGSFLGRSDYSGVEGLMDALDETWTSWMRDVRLGRGRIIVPAEYLRTMPNSKGQGGWFDVDQETFTPLEGTPPGELPMTSVQFAIRTTEHMDTATALIERIVSTAGYSASSFGLEGDKEAQTATEIESRERRSFITRDKKAQYWAPALRDILMAALELDQAKFNGPGVAMVKVKFSDSVREDPGRKATAIELLSRASAASISTLVQMASPNMTDDQIKSEVQEIMKEKGMLVPSPALPPTLPGGDYPPVVKPAAPGAKPIK